MNRIHRLGRTSSVALALALAISNVAEAQEYPEAVIQWGVTSGESCEDIAKIVYGSTRHAHLVARYNRVSCTAGAPLAPATLVLPARVTDVARARLGSLAPEVRLKPPGSGWSTASAGQSLLDNSSVNTLEEANATIQFVDTTRIHLSENTLVIIFGTAAASSVATLRPADFSVDSGEIKASLRALRGEDAVEVDVAGGRVSAASTDTVISAKGTRTNVAVFNGKSKVRSQGTSVSVNEGFGTRFEQGKAPEAPRALPKAPKWRGSLPRLALAEPSRGVLEAAWEPTDDAVSYRVELAKDAEFFQLLAREEVSKDITSFRAENLAEGTYFLRVRVLDKDEFLGIAATVQTTTVVGVSISGRAGDIVQPGKLTVHPYGSLGLSSRPSDLAVGFDDGATVPAPQAIEFGKLRPRTLELTLGETKERWALEYVALKTEISATQGEGGGVDFAISLDGLGDASNFARMRASLLTIEDGALTKHPLGAPTMDGELARSNVAVAGAPTAAMLVDGWGRTLGTWETPADIASPAQKLAPRPRPPRPYAPIVSPWSIDPAVPRLWAPTAQSAIYASIATVQPIGVDTGEASEPSVQGLMEIAGSIETVSLEAAFRTNDSTTDRSENEIAWVGARYRLIELDSPSDVGLLDVGPGLRLGFPTADGGPSFQAELGVAAAGRKGMWGWIADVVFDVDGEPAAYPYVPSFATGVLVQPMPWFRAFAAIDAYATRKLVNELGIITDGLDPRFAGGLSLGAEAGHIVFGALGVRATPFEAPRQEITFTAALGLRSEE